MLRKYVLGRPEPVILDGAMGTLLLTSGLKPGASPTVLNLTAPDTVAKAHRAYLRAGADMILTNTFSANRHYYSAQRLGAVIRTGIELALRAGGPKAVIGDIGPVGFMIRPYGKVAFAAAVRAYREIARHFGRHGIRTVLLETFVSISEAKAALLAAREFCPNVIVSFTFEPNGTTLSGYTPEAVAATFTALGATAIGVNCTLPDVAVRALRCMSRYTDLPLLAKPNIKPGARTAAEPALARRFGELRAAGATLIGGCCGTTPSYIRLIARQRRCCPAGDRPSSVGRIVISGPARVVTVDPGRPVLVGERLNPSGRTRIREAIVKQDFAVYTADARQQEQCGAQALDVNVFSPGADERRSMAAALSAVMAGSGLPLFIDTQDFAAAREALEHFPGVGVFNSVPATDKALSRWLPLARRYGFKTVVSCVGRRLPRTVSERLENAFRAVRVARRIGYPVDDLIFDPLVLPVATEPDQVEETLEAVRRMRRRGWHTILGVSNVSYGLPYRSGLNSALVAAAVAAGVSFIIANPCDERIRDAWLGSVALLHGGLRDYLDAYRESSGILIRREAKPGLPALTDAIERGDVFAAVQQATSLCAAGTAVQTIVDRGIVRALSRVGVCYERGKAFIPDLLKAAQAAQAVLDSLRRDTTTVQRRGIVLLATVQGDIHDIGKNIVAMVLNAAGYEVIDLGRDVAAARVLGVARQRKPNVIGLSALLTTTMPGMAETIKILRQGGCRTPVIIGGPHVSARFAAAIGAAGAARDALSGLSLVNKICRRKK